MSLSMLTPPRPDDDDDGEPFAKRHRGAPVRRSLLASLRGVAGTDDFHRLDLSLGYAIRACLCHRARLSDTKLAHMRRSTPATSQRLSVLSTLHSSNEQTVPQQETQAQSRAAL